MSNSITKFVVCAFHTPDYSETAAGLRRSIDAQGLDAYIKEIPAVRNWEAGTRKKPEFVLECLSRFANRNILYLDADARVRKPLDNLEFVAGDVGLHFRAVVKRGRETMHPAAGTVFVRNNTNGLRFVEAWVDQVSMAESGDVDGDCLIRAIGGLRGITFTQLAEAYCAIHDSGRVAKSERLCS